MGDWEWTLTIKPGRKGGPGSGHHGHAGRPGQVGGSAPGKGGGGKVSPGTVPKMDFEADKKAAAFLSDGLPEKNSFGNTIRDADGNPRWSGESRPMIKQEVVSAVAAKCGLTENMVNLLVGRWADTSADEDIKALETQEAAGRVFGTEPGSYVSATRASLSLVGEEGWPLNRQDLDGFVKAVYDNTQERLAAAGFKPNDTITLYRGTGVSRDTTLSDGDVLDVGLNPLSSWSSAPSEALKFAGSIWGPQGSLLLKMEVPISTIVSTARTGIGCLPECEFVVIGGQNVAHQARVMKVIMDYDDIMALPKDVRESRKKAKETSGYMFIDAGGNEDWIKTPENRESERRIHEELAKELEKGKDAPPAT